MKFNLYFIEYNLLLKAYLTMQFSVFIGLAKGYDQTIIPCSTNKVNVRAIFLGVFNFHFSLVYIHTYKYVHFITFLGITWYNYYMHAHG